MIAVSFLPVLTLEAQEGRLFKPLAYTKNFSMIVAAVLAITLDPALRLLFTHMQNFEFRPRWLARAASAVLVGKIHSEENHPISRILIRLYEPVAAWTLRWKWLVIAGAIAAGGGHRSGLPASSARSSCRRSMRARCFTCPPPARHFGRRKRSACCRCRTASWRAFPEVDQVLGKAGRAETSTDPAPLSMAETIITLKPRGPVAQSRYLVFGVGAGLDPAASSATSRPTTFRRRTWWTR